MLFKSRMTCRLPSRAAALLLLLAVLVACLGTSASMVGSRGANSAHTTRFLRKVEPLSSFHVTHDGDDEGGIAKPLAGFHPDAPPVAPPVQRTTPEIEEEEEVDANSDEDHDKHAPSVTTDSSASWSELRTDGKYTAADLAHWSVGGAPHAYHDGRAQLFPDGVQLHFTALGESFSLDLRIMRDLFVPGSEGGATVMDADGRVIGTHPHVLQSYWSSLPNGGWATATLHRDGRFQAVVHRDGDTIQVDPVRAHQADMSPTQFVRLHRASHTPDADGAERRGMVVHRHSDLVDLSLTHRLAMVDVVNVSSTERRRDVRHEDVQEESLRPFVATSFASSTSTRRAMHTTGFAHKTHPAPPRPAGASPFPSSDGGWTDCYSGDHAPHRVSVGFAVDAGMYEALGSSVAAVQQHIASQVAVANLVFLPQLHVYLTVADIVIFTAPTTNGTDNDSPVWNERPTVRGERTCATEIGPKLTAFSKWRAAVHPRRNALWNLQTNCYPPAGAVGLAWTGVLCDEAFGASVSSYTSQQWLTTTHELGHNFGATHTFQHGVGSTGGIMDYGDGRLDGVYQFSSRYSKKGMCAALSRAADETREEGDGTNTPFSPYCMSPYAPECGNSVLEPGEVCDNDDDPCCARPGEKDACQLREQCRGSASATAQATPPEASNTASSTAAAVSLPTEKTPSGSTDAASSFTWTVSKWTACSAECGGGTQEADVRCAAVNGITVDDSACDQPKPSSKRDCATQPCAAAVDSKDTDDGDDESDHATLTYSAWSTCSTSCGGGRATRIATCVRRKSGGGITIEPHSACAGLDREPTAKQCNAEPCTSDGDATAQS